MQGHQWLRSLWRSIGFHRPATSARRARIRHHRRFAAAECLETRILPSGVSFSADTYEFTVTEGASNTVVGMVAADDPEGYGVMYWVEDTPNWDFYLDYDGSLLYYNTVDYEQGSSYTLVIGATNGSTSDYAIVTVNVIDLDDEMPIFNQASYSVTRPEDESVAPGSALMTVSASDLDTDAADLTYSLLTAGTPFSVAADGTVVIDGPLDYEAGSTYDLEIQVEDLGGHTATTTLTVNLTDIDDEAPTVAAGQSFSVGDNSDPGTWIGTLDAYDLDTDPTLLTFSIVGGDDFDEFQIDECGSIYIKRALDNAVIPAYDLKVEVSDGVNTTTTTVHIDVLLENEAPVITSFGAVCEGGGRWTFSGTVEDENPLALTIVFGGLMEGQVIVVEADGTFTLSHTFPEGTNGIVTAKTHDEYYLESNVAEDYVF